MSEPVERPVNRILLAIDASIRGEDILETAVETAVLLKAKLHAVFVEDINLFRLAELPFAKELDRSSGAVRSMDSTGISRSLRADAQKFERRLTEASKKRKVTVSMKVVRGHCASVAMDMADEDDVIFLSNTSRVQFGRARRAVSSTEVLAPAAAGKSIWVVYDGSPAANRGLVLAFGLARRRGSELLVLMTPGLEEGARTLAKELVDQAPGIQWRFSSLVDFSSIGRSDPARGCQVLVVPRILADRGEVPDALKCPRLLV